MDHWNACKICLTSSSTTVAICPVCQLDKNSASPKPTSPEWDVRYFCRAIRFIGIVYMLIAAIQACGLVLAVAIFHPPFPAVVISLGVPFFSFVLGSALRSYEKWTFYAAVLHCALTFLFLLLAGLAEGFSPQILIWGLIPGLMLYHIAHPVSRTILLQKPVPGIAATTGLAEHALMASPVAPSSPGRSQNHPVSA